jgi:hypothetical protein
MGHKVNPVGLRLGINRTWDSRWFAGADYASLLHDDLKLREHLRGRQPLAATQFEHRVQRRRAHRGGAQRQRHVLGVHRLAQAASGRQREQTHTARAARQRRQAAVTPGAVDQGRPQDGPAELLHPKYKLPARCFAYVGNAADPHTWKLPHLDASGAVDERRLPKAIQAVLTNYRGVKVGGIPEPAIPDVLSKLAQAAERFGRLPGQGRVAAAPIYEQLAEALSQLRRTG